MAGRLLILAQPVGLIVYSAAQWLLFFYFVHSGGLALGGDFALAQAIIAPAFALLSFSLRQIWVTRATGSMSYHDLVLVRLGTTIFAILAILVATDRIGLHLHPAPFLLVLFLKSQETLADILYAKLDSEKRSALAGGLLTLKGLLVGLAVLGVLVAAPPLATAAVVIGGAALAVLVLEGFVVLSGGGRMRLRLRESATAVVPVLRSIAWLSAANLVITIAGFLPRYALEVFGSREAVGLFTAVTMPASVMLMICTGLAQSSLRELAEAVRERASRRFAGLIRRLFALAFALATAAAVLLLSSGAAVRELLGSALDPSLATMMAVVMLISIPTFAAQFLSYAFLALRTYHRLLAINGAGLAAQLVVAWPLVQLHPVYGAALLAATVSLVQIPFFVLCFLRHFRRPPPAPKPVAADRAHADVLDDL